MQSQTKDQLSPILAALALAAVLCLNFPAVVYHANAEDIDSPFAYTAIILVPLCALLTALFAAPGLYLKNRARRIYAGILAALAVVGWVTGTFLIGERGLLNGADLLRADPLSYQITELIALSVGFVLLVLLAFYAAKVFKPLILILIVMVIGTAAFSIIQEQKSHTISSTDNPFFHVSSKKNVFVFLFDAFLSDLFQDIIKKHPELAREFDGFTYFSKATGVAPTTYLSLPAIHSGIPYTEKLSLKAYYRKGIRNGSFLLKLAAAGYDTAGVNFVEKAPEDVPSYRANEMGEGFWRAALTDALFLFDISLYRFSPSILKQRIYNEGDWFTSNIFFDSSRATESNRLLDTIGERFRPALNKPAARWMHLYNTHPPASVDAECNRKHHLEWNQQNAENQAVCAVRHFVQTLNQFKKNGIYDNSVILLIADHGIGFSVNRRPRVLGSAHPVFVAKPIGKHGPLQISEQPVFLTDVPKTVCALSGDCNFPVGVSAFDHTAAERPRVGIFYEYKWHNQYWHLKHLPIFQRYYVSGPVDDVLSWYKKIPLTRIKTLHLNFDDKDDPEIFGFGWARSDKTTNESSRNANAPFAQLYLPLKPQKSATLEIQFRTHPKNQHQTVTLYVDQQKIGTQPLPAGPETMMTFEIPGDAVAKPLTRLTFEFSEIFERNQTRTNRGEVYAVAATFSKLDVRY